MKNQTVKNGDFGPCIDPHGVEFPRRSIWSVAYEIVAWVLFFGLLYAIVETVRAVVGQ